jgi:hypothetical protein
MHVQWVGWTQGFGNQKADRSAYLVMRTEETVNMYCKL